MLPMTDGMQNLANFRQNEAGLGVLDVVAASPGDDMVRPALKCCELSLQVLPDPLSDTRLRSRRSFGDPVADHRQRKRPDPVMGQSVASLRLGSTDVHLFPIELEGRDGTELLPDS
jgi:hypothetical protein